MFYLPFFAISIPCIALFFLICYLFRDCNEFVFCVLLIVGIVGAACFGIGSVEWPHHVINKVEYPQEIIKAENGTLVFYKDEWLTREEKNISNIPKANICVKHTMGWNSYGFVTEDYLEIVKCNDEN